MADKTVAMAISIPADVNELLKDAAERAHRSKIQHVLWLLEQAANEEYAAQQKEAHFTGG